MKPIFKLIGFFILAELLLLVVAFCMMWFGNNFAAAMEFIWTVTVDLVSGTKFHIAGLITSSVFWMFLYFKKVYKSKGLKVMTKKLTLYLLLPLGLLFTSFQALNQYRYDDDFQWTKNESVFNDTDGSNNHYARDSKIRGMHVFGRGNDAGSGIDRLVSANVEWLAHVPYGYQRTTSTTEVRHSKKDSLNQWTRRDSSFILLTEQMRSKGVRSIMKPHIWMSNAGSAEWRNAINFDNEVDWKIWEDNYHSFIMHYAEMAEEFDMEMLCIGVEMRSTVRAREGFWRGLIRDVRKVYKGKITYGANWWEEFEEVPFWDALDYIGIQAYFPLSGFDSPSVNEIKKGWKPHYSKLKSLSKNYRKPILFTEIGYRNTIDTATKPWEWPESIDNLLVKTSIETQYNCYEAFFETFWKEDWFAGALFWQWHISDGRRGNRQMSITFSPQGKPAEQSMAEWFGDAKAD